MPIMSRRDEAQAHRFLARRLAGALLRDELEGPDAPMRKLAIASFASVMVALLAVTAFGALGALHPGSSASWKSGTALIVERETGTRFIYTGGELHPVLNYASARLVLGQQKFTIATVSETALAGVPRGLPIGIPGAPDELPTLTTLARSPWSVCSLPSQGQAGGISPYVRLSIGTPAVGAPLTGTRGLLVASPDGTTYLAWNDQRFRLSGGTTELTALNYSSARALPVGDAWLSAMPQGPDLAAPTVPGIGSPGPMVGGQPSLVGQVYVASGSGGSAQYFLAYKHRLASISLTQADLALAMPAAQGLYPTGHLAPIPVSAAAVAAVATVPLAGATSLPPRPPPIPDASGGQLAVCAVYSGSGDSLPQVRTFGVPASALPQAPTTTPTDALGFPLANQVRILPGDGAVAQEISAPGQAGGTVYLITSQGIKYPLSSTGLLASLGLAGVRPALLPAAVLDLIPSGPTLDQHAATLTTAQP